MNKKFRVLTLLISTIIVSGCQTTNQHANLYNKYINSPNNKAYSVGVNGVSGAAWSSQTIEDAKIRANSACKNSGGINCAVTEINGKPIGSQRQAQPVVTNSEQSTIINNTYNLNSSQKNYSADLGIQSSGFFVNATHLITTSYMTDRCEKLRFERDGKLFDLDVIRVDASNRLALLKSSKSSDTSAIISTEKLTMQGDRVYAYGYNLSDSRNSGSPTYQGRITDGIVSSANGQFNDVRVMKITNDKETWTVGGPIFNEYGKVRGILTSEKEDAIKSSMLNIFLSESGITFSSQPNSKSLPISSIAENGKSITVPLVCFNPS